MIKLEHTDVTGFKAALRSMRNPMNSWDKSDSFKPFHMSGDNLFIGSNDYNLAIRLSKAGTDHRKYMRMINVTVDITAPLYFLKQIDTYKVGTVCNSTSSMHKIHAKQFTLDDFSCEHMSDSRILWLQHTISLLNEDRISYIDTNDKKFWWNMIQSLPSSYNQMRTMQFNYEVLCNIYHSRKNHKLDEWNKFCDWIETLPYSELITHKED